MLIAPFAAIDEQISRACMQALADVVVTRASGGEFLAQYRVSDEQPFDQHAVVESESILFRLIDAPGLAPGETLTLNGGLLANVEYSVLGDPQRVNAQEARAQIVRVSA